MRLLMNTNRLAFLGLGAALAAAPAHAYVHQRIEAKVPFRFTVEDKSFPAGRYVIEPISANSPSALQLKKADGSARTIFLTTSAAAGNVGETPRLVFGRHGRKRVLRAVYEGGSESGAEFGPVPVEPKRVARATSTKRSAGTANKRASAAKKRPLSGKKAASTPAATGKKTASR